VAKGSGTYVAMSESKVRPLRTLMIQLRNLICDAYEEQDFTELLFEEELDFDFMGLPAKDSYKTKALKVVQWAYRSGQAEHVLRLARVVSNRRPLRNDIKGVLQHLEERILVDASGDGAVSPPGVDGRFLPPDLETPLALFEGQPREMIGTLRPQFRATSYQCYDLPGRFHLSGVNSHRLLAVLALEVDPDATYLRWLSERVTVELPVVGYVAAQALTTAALRTENRHLREIRGALKNAGERLDELIEVEDPTAIAHNIAARKRQVQLALSLLDFAVRAQHDAHAGGVPRFPNLLRRGLRPRGYRAILQGSPPVVSQVAVESRGSGGTHYREYCHDRMRQRLVSRLAASNNCGKTRGTGLRTDCSEARGGAARVKGFEC
jgi:hypothetical protein